MKSKVASVLAVAACYGGGGGGSAEGDGSGGTEASADTSADPEATDGMGTDSDDGPDDDTGTGPDGDDPGTPGACVDTHLPAVGCGSTQCSSWCDPATWGGAIPDANTEVEILDGMRVVVDCDAVAGRVEIAPGGSLIASRADASTLTVHGNLVVRGRLDFGTPSDRIPAAVTAEVVFTGMQDSAYVGTPSIDTNGVIYPADVVEGDTGLWVVGDGQVTMAGVSKRSWSRLTADAPAGSTTLAVTDAAGWEVGDRVFLTPTLDTSDPDFVEAFDETTIQAIDGQMITVSDPLVYLHHGCEDCLRRGEVGNLTRNVVLRSADDEAHAHALIGDRGVIQLDGVELRWLGPTPKCGDGGEPARRRLPLYFHQQEWDADDSFVCATAIWGGEEGFMTQERSHGVTVENVVGYDTAHNGFNLIYDQDTCGGGGNLCGAAETERPATEGTILRDVLSARIRHGPRASDCQLISHRLNAFQPVGGEGSGCVNCVAAGVSYGPGTGSDMAGFMWGSIDSGRPLDFTFENSVAHNIRGHGMYLWHNQCQPQEFHHAVELWSLYRSGIMWGAYGCKYSFAGITIEDSVEPSIQVQAVPADDRPRLDGATLQSMHILSYILVQGDTQQIFRDLHFTGPVEAAVTQVVDSCGSSGVPDDDPASIEAGCSVATVTFDNATFEESVAVPFRFGNAGNLHTAWVVTGFEHPGFPNVPRDFTLHHPGNQVVGGCYHPGFDAWIVPGKGGSSCQ